MCSVVYIEESYLWKLCNNKCNLVFVDFKVEFESSSVTFFYVASM